MTFKDFYKGKIGTDKRHMHPIVRDVSSHPKHPGRTVPHMHRSNHRNQKVKSLLSKPSGRYVLNDKELRQIQTEFHLGFDNEKSKKLGNTGITLRFDPLIGKPVLEK